MGDSPAVDIVIPCHNEEDSAPALISELQAATKEAKAKCPLRLSFNLYIVDDGSTDGTVETFRHLLAEDSCFHAKRILRLSRNFGKEAGIVAGMKHCHGDACIIMDADLQDPPSLIPEMIKPWLDGYKIVNAVRNDRTSDGFFKRLTAEGFYTIFYRLSKLKVQFNASDYRLLDKVIVSAIAECNERVRFSKGFFAWVGYEPYNIYFTRSTRSGGSTKWGSWKLWNYALDGIFNFSTAPLRVWSYIGLLVTIGSFVVGMVSLLRTILLGIDVPGYASLFTAVTFLGGLQLIGIGILGEYIGRAYIEAKARPHFIIRQVIDL